MYHAPGLMTMLNVFLIAFAGTFSALLKIILVMILAGFLVRRGVLTQAHISSLSKATVDLFLPCLIVAKIVSTFEPGALPLWWILPLAGVLMPLIGLGISSLVFSFDLKGKRNILPLASMQNAGYLVLPVGLALDPQNFDTFAVYCFLFILGYNPILWSVGKVLSTESSAGWRGLVTPPFVANFIAIAVVFCGAGPIIPSPVLEAIDLIGQAAVPVATVILGAVLGTVHLKLRHHLGDALRILFVKYAAIPALVITLLLLGSIHLTNPLLSRFFILEASAAPAVAIILQVRAYGGDEAKIGPLMLIAYLACGFFMPFWLAIWELLIS